MPLDIAKPGDLRPGDYQSLARSIRASVGQQGGLNIALLSSNSFEFLDPYLVVECARRDLPASLWSAPFGQIEQAILDEGSELWSFMPAVVVVGVRIEDVYPDAFVRGSHDGGATLQQKIEECVDRLDSCVATIRARSDARVLVSNFALPQRDVSLRVFDANNAHGCAISLATANRELTSRIAGRSGAEIWDYSGLVSARGAATWTDQRLWQLARQPIAAANMPFAAEHLAKTISAMLQPRAKCLVLDLDNTLWGGAAGDDGIQGIVLGDDYPGSAFKSFQRAVLGLRDQGVLLAISSKNDERTAREIIENHPEMLLRWEDFVCARINWDSKSANLMRIAEEVGVGVDSLVFFDDNPVERAEVQMNAPDVNVIDVPVDPINFQDALFDCGLFDTPTLSAEDAQRAQQYSDEARRLSSRKPAGSLQDFLRDLEMKASIDDVDDQTLSRASQLIGKTNQFNLTTRRHNQATLSEMIAADNYDVRFTRLHDKFGDSGIIGITIVQYNGNAATIDSFLMSCRVMNRQVECAMLCDIAERSRGRDCSVLRGIYVPTAKNEMIADLYSKQGFSLDRQDADGSHFSIDLSVESQSLQWPEVLSRN